MSKKLNQNHYEEQLKQNSKLLKELSDIKNHLNDAINTLNAKKELKEFYGHMFSGSAILFAIYGFVVTILKIDTVGNLIFPIIFILGFLTYMIVYPLIKYVQSMAFSKIEAYSAVILFFVSVVILSYYFILVVFVSSETLQNMFWFGIVSYVWGIIIVPGTGYLFNKIYDKIIEKRKKKKA